MTDAVLDDPSDELLTALEILAEEAQLWTNGVPTEHDEFYAAVSAVLLLVPELLDEYSAAWIGLAELRQVVLKLQDQVEKLTTDAAEALWTPRVALPQK